MIVVRQGDEISHAWVGGRLVRPLEDGTMDPRDVAAEQLRTDCANDRRELMRDLRRNVLKGYR